MLGPGEDPDGVGWEQPCDEDDRPTPWELYKEEREGVPADQHIYYHHRHSYPYLGMFITQVLAMFFTAMLLKWFGFFGG